MKICCISDLHGYLPELESGDLLVIAGDLTGRDKVDEWNKFYIWLKRQDYRCKVYIGGNHDNLLTRCISDVEAEEIGLETEPDFIYLQDSGYEFEGLKIWGSPWTMKFRSQNEECMAFALDIQTQMSEKWELIPKDTDILITHSPPYGIGDDTIYKNRAGCYDLICLIRSIRPKLHVFGHIHEGAGRYEEGGTIFVNASHVNAHYDPVNKPIYIELSREE